MKLNRIDLKKIMYDFNSIANRFMRVNWQDYSSMLSKFLTHIESVEVINAYIKDYGKPTYSVEKEVTEVADSYGRAIFELGDTEQQEIANIYGILK